VIVDAHLHLVVPEILREAAPEEEWRPRVWWEDGTQLARVGDGPPLRSMVREAVDVQRVLAEQDASGVEAVVASPWVSLIGPNMPEEATGIQNDALAGVAAAHPRRITALGAVPLHDPPRAADELRELMRRPGVAGVEVPTSVGGRFLGDDALRPFWAAAEETRALVFVHPSTRGLGVSALDDFHLWNTVGNPLETTIAAAHLVFNGVLEEHPGLRILLAHGGGAVLALRGRLRHAWERLPHARARLGSSPDDSLGRFLYDTVVHDVDVLRTLVATVGAENVLLGSDYPFDMGSERPAELVRAAGLPPGEEAAILGGNAERLMEGVVR
jgi:aminocarboxymuconate-semialdehyde decarboxylase